MSGTRVAVLGAGAIGSLFGARLSRCANVILIARKAHVDAIRSEGLRIEGIETDVARVEASDDTGAVKGAELVLVTTKAFDTEPALRSAQSALNADATVVLIQNGLGNEEAARRVLPAHLILRGLTYHGVTFLGPGRIRWVAQGRTVIGAPFGDTERLGAVVALFRRAGLEVEAVDDVRRAAWHKTLGNVGINALGALTGMRNGEIVENPHTRELLERLVREAEAVARAEGYEFDAVDDTIALARATGANKNSMLQDLERGRRTEIDFLNGAVVAFARKAGIDAPYNATVTSLVKAFEQMRCRVERLG